MAALNNFQSPGQNNGAGDSLASMLKVFSGETLTAFAKQVKVMDNHIVKTIDSGRSAQFPVSGRTVARYLKPGMNLDDDRQDIKHNEKIIQIDGLLTADVLITDIYEAMSHVDWRQEYSRQLGETLAVYADRAVLAELAKLAKQPETLAGLGTGTIVNKSVTGAGTGISAAYGEAIVEALLEIRGKFTSNYVPMEDRFLYMTSTAYNSLIAAKTSLDRDYGAVATIVEGNIDKLLGFKVIEVPEFTLGGAPAKNALQGDGHVFPTDLKQTAFIAAHRSAVGTLKLKALAVEHARRTEYQADQIVAKYAMGHGGLRPEAVAVCTIATA